MSLRLTVPCAALFFSAVLLGTAHGQDRNLGVACSVAPSSAGGGGEDSGSGAGGGTVFAEVADAAGIGGAQHYTIAVPPRCLLDDWSSRDRVAHGSLCDPEANTAGVTAGDFDGDGRQDLLVTALGGTGTRLFRNEGNGRFEDVTAQSRVGALLEGVPTTGAGFGDVDRDGDLDIYVLSIGTKRFHLLINDGAGRFTEEALERGCAVSSPFKHVGSSIAFGDFDGDGYLDMHTTAWLQPGRTPYDQLDDRIVYSEMRLLRNLGAEAPGYFEDVTRRLGVGDGPMPSRMWKAVQINGTFGFTSTFVDLDDDGALDIAVASDFATTQFYWNKGDGTFEEGFLDSFTGGDQNAMGSTFADYDGDGRLDWFVSGIYDEKQRCRQKERGRYCPIGWRGNYLYRNLGGRRFENRAEAAGVQQSGWAWGAAFLDYDNDGDADLAVANNYLLPGTIIEDDFNQDPNRFYVNVGGGRFEERGAALGFADHHQGRGVVTVDYDNDGDLDIVVATFGGTPRLFRNDHPRAARRGRWLRVLAFDYPPERAPTEPVTRKRSPALNAKVTVVATPGAEPATQYIGVRSHLYGASEPHAHFGLGGPAPRDGAGGGDDDRAPRLVHEVTISWPNRNATITLRDTVMSGSTLHVYPPGADGSFVTSAKVLACTMSGGAGAEGGPGSASRAGDPTVDGARSEEADAWRTEREQREERQARDAKLWSDHLDALRGASRVRIDLGSSLDALLGTALVQRARASAGVVPAAASSSSSSSRPSSAAAAAAASRFPRAIGRGEKQHLRRVSPARYADGISSPAGPGRPSARLVSNMVMAQGPPALDAGGANQLLVTFGQFVSHDTDFSTPLFRPTPTANFPIEVPRGDLWFDADGTGLEVLRFRRSMYDTATGHAAGSPRQQVNQITPALDGSIVYGSAAKTTEYLRDGPYLRLDDDGYLPRNRDGLSTDNPMGRMVTALNVAGDSRVNVQPGLLAMHTIFAREHNRWAAAIGERTGWAPDTVFAAARRVVVALLQKIVTTEYLPRVVAPRFAARLDPSTYRDRSGDRDADPRVANEFATAAFRFGHSQVDSKVWRVGSDGRESRHGHVPLRDAYFSPERTVLEGGIDDVVRGMLAQPAQAVDTRVVDDLRNFLFGSSKEAGGLDLAAANIQRGRDHGLADYNSVRAAYGLPRRTSFAEITSDDDLAARLETLYAGDIDDVDLFIGGLAEDPVSEGSRGVLGETFSEILVEQFIRTRDTDPEWYLSAFDADELREIESITLADIIARNTGLPTDSTGTRATAPWSRDVFSAASAEDLSSSSSSEHNRGTRDDDDSRKGEL